MFRNINAFFSYSVDDIFKAKEFYGGKLKLDVSDIPGMKGILNIYFPGGGRLIVYAKPDHKPATFTVLNFPVKDIEKTVSRLAASGIIFEKYEGDLKTDEKGIFRGQGPLIAWFKDPAGNILSVLQEN